MNIENADEMVRLLMRCSKQIAVSAEELDSGATSAHWVSTLSSAKGIEDLGLSAKTIDHTKGHRNTQVLGTSPIPDPKASPQHRAWHSIYPLHAKSWRCTATLCFKIAEMACCRISFTSEILSKHNAKPSKPHASRRCI